MIVLRAVALFFVAPTICLSGCGSFGGESRTFESLLVMVEEGESVLEAAKPRWTPLRDDFLKCLAEINSRVDNCEDERESLASEFDTTLEAFEFSELKAELQALRLTDNPEASRARDAFVRHLRAWQEYISDMRNSMPTQNQIYQRDFEFVETWRAIWSSEEINNTFDELCSGLGNGQPANSDEFTVRIVDICND